MVTRRAQVGAAFGVAVRMRHTPSPTPKSKFEFELENAAARAPRQARLALKRYLSSDPLQIATRRQIALDWRV
jgi:hypothetical protein